MSQWNLSKLKKEHHPTKPTQQIIQCAFHSLSRRALSFPKKDEKVGQILIFLHLFNCYCLMNEVIFWVRVPTDCDQTILGHVTLKSARKAPGWGPNPGGTFPDPLRSCCTVQQNAQWNWEFHHFKVAAANESNTGLLQFSNVTVHSNFNQPNTNAIIRQIAINTRSKLVSQTNTDNINATKIKVTIFLFYTIKSNFRYHGNKFRWFSSDAKQDQWTMSRISRLLYGQSWVSYFYTYWPRISFFGYYMKIWDATRSQNIYTHKSFTLVRGTAEINGYKNLDVFSIP